jgi:hypothetical protein
MKRIVYGALLFGAVALATLGLGTGTAQADPSTGICNQMGMCSYVCGAPAVLCRCRTWCGT